MLGDLANAILGAVFYVLGVAAVNVYFKVPQAAFFIHPALELCIISAGIFFLSSFFYGRYGSVLLLFPGYALGTHFPSDPVMVSLALLPFLAALVGGAQVGRAALMDLKGKRNVFENFENRLGYLFIAIMLSVAIGLFTLGIQVPALPNPLEY